MTENWDTIFEEYLPYDFDAITLKKISNKIYPNLFESLEEKLQIESRKLRVIGFGV